MVELRLEDLLHGGHGLPLGEDHFREAAASAPVQVDLGLAQVGGRPADSADELLDGQFAAEHLGGQLFELVGVHISMIIAARRGGNWRLQRRPPRPSGFGRQDRQGNKGSELFCHRAKIVLTPFFVT